MPETASGWLFPMKISRSSLEPRLRYQDTDVREKSAEELSGRLVTGLVDVEVELCYLLIRNPEDAGSTSASKHKQPFARHSIPTYKRSFDAFYSQDVWESW